MIFAEDLRVQKEMLLVGKKVVTSSTKDNKTMCSTIAQVGVRIILCLMVLILTSTGTQAKSPEKRVRSNPNACPITTTTIPEQVIADHDVEVLTAIVSGIASGMDHVTWQASPRGDRIRFLFPEFQDWVVIHRLGIAISSGGEKQSHTIHFTWVPVGKVHGTHSGSFKITTDQGLQCFFLVGYAGIPGFEVREFVLELPPKVEIHSLLFSEKSHDGKSVSCPAPDLFNAVTSAYQDSVSHPEDNGKMSTFIELLKKAMFKYDCRRTFDYEPVPAWYLCSGGKKDNTYSCGYEDIDKWFHFLGTAESREAKELFASKLFRNTLDGMYAEQYQEGSLQVERQLKTEKKP